MAGKTHEDRRVVGKRPIGKGGSATADGAGFGKPRSGFGALVAAGFVALVLPRRAPAQTFDDASTRTLNEICVQNEESGGFPELGPNLQQRCNDRGNASSGVLSPAPATISPQPATIERRQQAVRESPEARREMTESGRIMYASYPRDAVLAQNAQLQLPPAGGASPEIVVSFAQGLSLFVSAGAFALNHHNNRFEDGYEAQLPTVTAGADYWFTSRLLAGAAFNYTNFDGTYDDGGGFDKDIFNPLLYATFLPFDKAFVSAVLGYSRNENTNDRRVGTIPTGDGAPFTGHTSADYSENLYSAGLQAGYDHPFGNFTVGPRLGFAFSHSQVDSFKEKGDTGLELRYSGLNQTSVQTSVGVAAAVDIAIPNGVLRPQASVAWVHEYANDARNIDARYVEASPSPEFTFQRERPARDWANIAVGASASLSNGLQPFVQFVTVQGNDNFVSYGGTAGLRFSF
jgi:uncharacterized protein YhjY with autotransporter beta-barrel domain